MLKHHMANQCTKFEVSSFCRSGDILGEVKNLMGHVTMTTPLLGVIFSARCNICTSRAYATISFSVCL